jgi:hypothetical protein
MKWHEMTWNAMKCHKMLWIDMNWHDVHYINVLRLINSLDLAMKAEGTVGAPTCFLSPYIISCFTNTVEKHTGTFLNLIVYWHWATMSALIASLLHCYLLRKMRKWLQRIFWGNYSSSSRRLLCPMINSPFSSCHFQTTL